MVTVCDDVVRNVGDSGFTYPASYRSISLEGFHSQNVKRGVANVATEERARFAAVAVDGVEIEHFEGAVVEGHGQI